MKTRRYAINTAACRECGACAKACPRKAIKIDMETPKSTTTCVDTCGLCAAHAVSRNFPEARHLAQLKLK